MCVRARAGFDFICHSRDSRFGRVVNRRRKSRRASAAIVARESVDKMERARAGGEEGMRIEKDKGRRRKERTLA